MGLDNLSPKLNSDLLHDLLAHSVVGALTQVPQMLLVNVLMLAFSRAFELCL